MQQQKMMGHEFSLPENFEREFYKILTELRIKYGCHYLFFNIEKFDDTVRLVFSSDPAWRANFIGEGLIKKCPLYISTVKSLEIAGPRELVLFPWHSIPIANKEQREVVGIRGEHGIGSGLTLAITFPEFRAMIGLGTDPKDKDFCRLAAYDPRLIRFSMYRLVIIAIKEMCSKSILSQGYGKIIINYCTTQMKKLQLFSNTNLLKKGLI